MSERIIAVYAGRFQPFHRGHYSVYQNLVQKYGADNVYIATSNKTDSEKSPFNFDEKKHIMTSMFNIPEDRVVQSAQPYRPTEILSQFDPETTTFVTAVSEKDAERLGGGKYFSKLDGIDDPKKLKGFSERGYYTVTPEFQLDIGGKNISGTTIRKALGSTELSDKARKKLFTMLYGKMDDSVYDLITGRLSRDKSIEEPSSDKSVAVPPDARVKNPLTKRDILVKTALKYPPSHPSHIAATKYIKSLRHEVVLHIKPVQFLYEDIDSALVEAILEGNRRELCLLREAQSSTERVRRYYKRHPEKVRKYLKKTQDDRVARNRDRRKAVKKYGKSKMKNHDVHHPNGAKNGNWRLARKDHGRDKVNESLLIEGGAAGHMMHPFDDPSLTFADFKRMIQMSLIGQLDSEAPMTEKLDGQNIAFTVIDGEVRFARNAGHIKNSGESSLTADQLRKKFGGRGDIEHTFGEAADDLQAAISSLSPEEQEKIFKSGSRFASVEVINPSSENIIPYNKTLLIIHNITEYDQDGEELGRSLEAGKYLANQIINAGADVQKRYGIKGPATITMNDYDTETYKEKASSYQRTLDHFRDRYKLSDDSTLGDYYTAWWGEEIDRLSKKHKIDLSPIKDGLIQRWAFGNKELQLHKMPPEARKFVRQYEKERLTTQQDRVRKPFERVFLKAGADALTRTTELLASNNPLAGQAIKKKVSEVLRQLRKTHSAEQVEFLDRQIRRLGAIGFDRIVPTEGLVFTYNGKPYKLTGAFAPINQLVGTMKFGRTPDVSEPKSSVDSSPANRQLIQPLLHHRIRNPATGRDIYIGTALGYQSTAPVYKAAKRYIQQQISRNRK